VDRQSLVLLIPIVAMLIPVAAIVMNGLQKMAVMRLEEAKARAAALGEGSADLVALREDVTELRQDLAEVHERLDFTERMLAQQREERRLPGH
jgi:Tfp pilus assembly protein PilO